MRSIGFTLILAVATLASGALAVWSFTRGNLHAFIGAPPVTAGTPLFADFEPERVGRITLRSGDTSAHFLKTEQGWQVIEPWVDRMDPRALIAILRFTEGLIVEDRAPAAETQPAETGLGDDAIEVHLRDRERQTVVRYLIGRRTPWLAEAPDSTDPIPTVFIQPLDDNRAGHVYSCTGDIRPLFNDGFRYLRDHHPFIPQPVQKIRIRGPEGESTVARESPQSPWRITKPLDLPTDPAAMMRLINGLVELKAVKLIDRAEGNLPTAPPTSPTRQIAVATFGSETETVLEIFPADSPDARTTLATVSDRPDFIFELPVKPEPGLVSLPDLPLSVNDLRDPTLTNLNIQSIASLAIRPATGAEILISRAPPQPWMATIDGFTQPANEQRLFNLLKAVTSGRATRFETDAATDLSPWGLDRPFLRLLFLAADNQTLELAFGLDTRGGIFVNRTGTPTVMRIDRSLLDQITVRAHEWRHSRLWTLNRVYLKGIKRTIPGESPVTLAYHFIHEKWTALREGTDATADVNPANANFLLASLEDPHVSRWLYPGDPDAEAALSQPSLILETIETRVDATGEEAGFIDRMLELAPAPEYPGAYYGRLSGEPHPFLIDGSTYIRLATDPLE
jgi:hypothetical protein